MKKPLPIIIVILLLIIAGGAYLSFQKGRTQPSQPSNFSQDQSQPGGVFESIRDALSKSLSLECTYKDERGVETKTYIKAGAVRVDSKLENKGEVNYSQFILKDRKMYSWDPTTKKGMVFEIPAVTPQVGSSDQPPDGGFNQESFLQEIEKYKNSCKTASVSDSLFTAPSDVTFEDISKMMQAK